MPSPSYVPAIRSSTSGNFSAGGNLSVGGSSTVSGNSTVAGNLTVTGVGQQRTVVKPAGTSRNTTVVPASDPDLTFPVVTGATYLVECVVAWANGGGGFRATWSVPAGASMVWTDNDGAGAAAASSTVTFSATTGTTLKGALVVAATAGDLTLQWAQNTSNAADTTLRGGCYLSLTRVA